MYRVIMLVSDLIMLNVFLRLNIVAQLLIAMQFLPNLKLHMQIVCR